MRDRQPIYQLFLMTILSLSQRDKAVTSHSSLSPAPHCRCLIITAPTLHPNPLKDGALEVRNQLDLVMWHGKIEYAETSKATLVLRGLDNTMDCAFVETP